jgi:ferrous iron transport protein B
MRTDLADSESAKKSFVALIGAPNCGKTTLYNWLTNSKFKTVNYPGATVEYSLGSLSERYNDSFPVMDTPGTYSLFPKSADEEVTVKALFEHPELGHAGKVIVVVDGTQMGRHLLLAKQIREAGFSFVIALTMSDLLQKNDINPQLEVLRNEYQCEVVPMDGLTGHGVMELVEKLKKLPPTSKPIQLDPWSDSVFAAKLARIEYVAQAVLGSATKERKLEKIYDRTAMIDRFLLHPWWGLVCFFVIMALVFSSIFWAAAPFMDLVDAGFSWLKDVIIRLSPESLWADFLGNGLIASFGAVMVFVPQIFILFLGIGLLEGSGYLARAATLIDKPFSKLGLSGRSFVPILSGFACAVPAMMASRNIGSKRDRMITNFVIPLMTCSARLPVYALLLAFLFYGQPAWKAGIALAALYLGSLVVGSVAAAIVNKILAKNNQSFFMMELPLYRRPHLRVLLQQSLTRTKAYVKRAGPMIFLFAVLIWGGTTFPHYQAPDDHAKLETSYLGTSGKMLEPVFRPLGVDWRVGVGLMSAFAAREVFVSSLAIMFNVGGQDEAQTKGLLQTMTDARDGGGHLIFTPASVVALLLFFMIALQCMSTFAISVKENGSMKFAVIQLVAFNVFAYLIAVSAYQLLS